VESLLVHIIAIAMTYALARAIGASVGLLELFVLLPPVMLIAAFPVSIAGWGVREFSMVAAFGFAGLAQGDGLMISLLTGLVQLVSGVIGGVMWITLKGNSKQFPATGIGKLQRKNVLRLGEKRRTKSIICFKSIVCRLRRQ
jgi:hypothetical protein